MVDPQGALAAFSRRRFLTVAGGGAGTALVLHALRVPGAAPATASGTAASPELAALVAASADSVTLVRAADQALVRFRFVNLELVGQELTKIQADAAAAIVVDVGPQHAAEEGVNLAHGEAPPAAAATRKLRGAGSSRVVVAVDAAIPFTVESLLDLASRVPVLDPRAVPPGTGSGAPSADVTAIEIPADVVLSPDDTGRFLADAGPATVGNVSELWRLRVGTDVAGTATDASTSHPLPLRAIHGGTEPDAFSRPLDQGKRADLVVATTDYAGGATAPLEATTFWMALTGAFVDMGGDWGRTSLAAYDESIRSGRTISVTVVGRGYLAPFGHTASVVQIGERQFLTAADGTVVSVLVLDDYLAVDDTVVTYPRDFMPHGGRRWPFTAVEIVPPAGDLERLEVSWTDADGIAQSIAVDSIFQLADGDGNPRVIDHVGTDRAGNRVQFATEVYFVPEDKAFSLSGASAVGKLRHLFDDTSSYALAKRTLALGGQSVAFADEAVPGSAATTKAVTELRFTLDRPAAGTSSAELEAAGQPAFFAAMESATVTDPALDRIRPHGAPTAPLNVTFHDAWLDHGNGAGNTTNAFLRLDNRLALDFGGGGGDGLVVPQVNVDVFGQDLGISIDLDGLTDWDPLDALGDAVLLGVIELKDILGSIHIGVGTPKVPGIPAVEIELDSPTVPTEVCLRFVWEPLLKSQSALGHPVFVVTADFGDESLVSPFAGETAALFRAEACAALDATGGDLDTDLEVSVHNFALLLPPGLPSLAVFVETVSFRVPPGGDPTLDFKVGGYQFVGMLSFLEPFRTILSGGTGGSLVDFGDLGIDVNVALSPPDVALGLLLLSDLRLELGLFVPSEPGNGTQFTAAFAIGTIAKPVALSVWLFRGTASFEIDMQPLPVGVSRFAASLGMGATIAAGGLGVSGSIGMEVAGSIEYVRKHDGSAEIVVGGRFTVWGEITVWVFASAGVSATLSLTYFVEDEILRAKGEVVGWAMVCGFQKEWRLQVSEDFEVGDGSSAAASRRALAPPAPTAGAFGDVYALAEWQTYCGAFA